MYYFHPALLVLPFMLIYCCICTVKEMRVYYNELLCRDLDDSFPIDS